MSIFAAAAQARIRAAMTGTVGSIATNGGLGEFLGSRFLRRTFWTGTGDTVAKVGMIIMDAGAALISAGWRLTVYGFFAWAAVGLLRNIGKIANGVIGSEILRSIPPAVEVPA